MKYSFEREPTRHMVVVIGPRFPSYIHHPIRQFVNALNERGHKVQLLPLEGNSEQAISSVTKAMRNRPIGTVLTLLAHGRSDEDHLVQLGSERYRLTPTLRLFSLILKERAHRPFDCILSSCGSGMLHKKIGKVLPNGSLFSTLSRDRDPASSWHFVRLLGIAMESHLAQNSLAADRLLIPYISRYKTPDSNVLVNTPITIVGQTSNENKISMAEICDRALKFYVPHSTSDKIPIRNGPSVIMPKHYKRTFVTVPSLL